MSDEFEPARFVMEKLDAKVRRVVNDAHDELLDVLFTKAQGRRAPSWEPNEPLTFAIVHPDRVVDKYHVVVDTGPEIKKCVADFLSRYRPDRTNHPGGVVIICPAQ